MGRNITMIRAVTPDDITAITAIYNYYILNSVATFEETILAESDIAGRVQTLLALNLPWLVAEHDGDIVGYAYAGQWKQRSAFRFAVEISVYLSPSLEAKGWGTKLYQALFTQLRDSDISTVIAGITLPNPASCALHEKMGMTKVGHFHDVGFKFDRWLDVGYWQVKL